MSVVLMNIIAPKSIEPAVIDWLLTQDTVSGFTSFDVSGHGSSLTKMSLSEKVRGRANKIQVEIHLNEQAVQGFLGTMKETFGGAGVHYYVTPTVSVGHL